MRNAILIALMVAFVSALSWALGLLSHAMDFSSFMLFGLLTIALMIAGGFAWDRYAGSPKRFSRK